MQQMYGLSICRAVKPKRPLVTGSILKDHTGAWKFRIVYERSSYENYGYFSRAAALADLREVLRGLEELR